MRKSVLKAISTFILTIMLTNGTFSYKVLANQIIIDHKTQTHVNQVGNVTNITTTTRSGANAFNSFSRFDISSGNIVNLFVPDDAKNLLNLVHSHRSEIHGTLNSISQEKIGGNVYFLNPHGFLVGENGTINVGSLTLLTPTTTYMNEFFTKTGVNNTLLNQAISGNVPIGNTGLISVQGKVNALDGILLQAAGVTISGELQTGAIFEHNLDFSNVVNVRDWEAGGVVVSEGGTIRIVAPQIEGSGTLRTDGELIMDATSTSSSDGQALTGQDIYLKSNSDLNIDTIYAIGHVDLRSNGAILNSTNPNQNIRAESLNLIAETIGTSSRFLKIGLDATGTLTAQANGNIYLDSPIRSLNTGSITSGGDIYIIGGESVNVGSSSGGIETQFGRVTIDARGSILSLDRGDKAGITAQDIRLETATGSIGSQENDLRINILSQGKFAAGAVRGIYVDAVQGDFHVANASSAGGSIKLTASEGNLVVDGASAQGNITMLASGTMDVATAIAGGDMNLVAQGNMIVDMGDAGNNMNFVAQGNMAVDTVNAGSNMSLAAQGDLVVGKASAQGNMALNAGGNVLMERVVAEQGTVSVSAGDNILGQGEQTTITANSIALRAETGRIGDPESLLKIDSSDSGTVTAHVKQGVYLQEIDGVLNIVSVRSEQGDLHIVADDSITGGNLSGGDITLRSIHGSIGEDGGHLVTETRGILNAHAQGSIFLTQQGGDLNSKQMWAEEGSVVLNVTSGQTQITALTASDGGSVTSSGNIAIGRLIALDVALLATGVDQSIEVNEALVGRSLSAHADQVYLPWVDHTGTEQLKMAIGGGSKKLAHTVFTYVESTPGVTFSKLYAEDIKVTGNTVDLAFYDTIVGNKATFKNKYYTVVADNVDKKLYAHVELQLFPDDKPFFLIMGEHRRMFTDADIVNYSNHFIINDFHTTNSFIRAATKLVELAGIRTQERRQSSFGDRVGLVHTYDSQGEDEEEKIDLPEVLQMGSAI